MQSLERTAPCSSRASTTSAPSPATRARNVDFYTRVLGLRLTAKTVNQDDPGVYHLFYGDEHATPGADLTFFEYPGAIPGRPGAGMVHRIVHRVGSQERSPSGPSAWTTRASRSTSTTARCASPTPRASTTSSSSTRSGDAPLVAVHPEIPAELAIRGFEGVRAYSLRPRGLGALLEGLMGAVARRGPLRAARRQARRLDRLRPGARRARPPERRHRPPHRVGHLRRRPDGVDRAHRRRPASRTRATSTATTSTRSTSASRAASSTSWRPRSPASWSTAWTSPSSARRSSCRRSSRTGASRSRRG